jgi:L-ascorbate metabolism protein UlaG (beta-lactamase superfamily)
MSHAVSRIWSWAWRGLLGLLILLLLAPTLVPPFLDRIYYRGPVSAHYDGQHFFNPDGDAPSAGSASARLPLGLALKMLSREQRTSWPAHVATPQGAPVALTDPKRMVVTWIGHSTVLVQAGGINILTDPIYAEHAGPWGLIGPKRVRDPGIAFDRLPHIDLVLVSHDHWDHMDVPTLKRLWARDRPLIVTSLGNDTILKNAGVPAVARDWGGTVTVRPAGRLADGRASDPIVVTVERVHHWGSRWLKDRNRALWSGFSVRLPGGNLFFAGDTGLGDGSWPIEAAKDGPYRLALIPIGAYEPRAMMGPSHIGPVEAVRVFETLGAAHALAVHWGTFKLSSERMYDPPNLLHATTDARGIARGRFRALEVGVNWDVPPLK